MNRSYRLLQRDTFKSMDVFILLAGELGEDTENWDGFVSGVSNYLKGSIYNPLESLEKAGKQTNNKIL